MQLLLTGASGFLGSHIITAAAKPYKICGWYGSKPPQQQLQQAAAVNLGDAAAVEKAFYGAAPDAVLHCAAITSIAGAEKDAEWSHRVNVQAAAQLAALCARAGTPFLFCSTDMVFDGATGHYTETDAPAPINVYGRQKALAELAVQEACPEALVLRLPLLLGYVPGSAAGTIHTLIECNGRGDAVTLFTNEYRSVAWAADVAAAMLMALEKGWQGLYHMGGPQPLSRYETGLLVKQQYGLTRLHIQGLTLEQAGATGRPANATLDSKKAFAKGYKPHTIPQALEILTSP